MFMRLAWYLKKGKPEKEFLLGLLFYLHPDNEIFKADYKPPQYQQTTNFVSPMVMHKNEFFSNLQELNVKQLKKKGGVTFLDKK